MKNDFVGVSLKIRNQSVTGSQIRLMVKNGESNTFLIDNGVFQDASETEVPEEDFSSVRAVFLTHAHIDHSGGLAEVMKQVEVPVYATAPTKQLVVPMLNDMYNIMGLHGKKFKSEDDKAFDKLKKMLKEVKLYSKMSCGNCEFTFLDNAHILGSSMIMAKALDEYRPINILFSGDYRDEHPFLRTHGVNDYLKKNSADVLVLESTYGNKPEHIPYDEAVLSLQNILEEGLKKGSVLLGTFSIDRTPVVLHMINQIQQVNPFIAEHEVVMDGVLAMEGLKVYSESESRFKYLWGDIIPKNLTMIQDKYERSTLQNDGKNKIIVATSGQFHGGSIVSWAAKMLSDENATIVSTGFISHPIGKKIFELPKGEEMEYFGQTLSVNAERKKIEGISAHADRTHLANLVEKCLKYNPKLKVILTHGEMEAKYQLRQFLAANVIPFENIYIQEAHQHFEINKHTLASGKMLVDD